MISKIVCKNIKKIKGNIDIVKVVFPDHFNVQELGIIGTFAKISTFSAVGKMYFFLIGSHIGSHIILFLPLSTLSCQSGCQFTGKK